MCVLGHDPCGGSEVMLWEDVRLLQDAGMSIQVYGSAAKESAPVTTIPLYTNLPLVTSLEYCGSFVRREKESILMACNEPSVAAFAPDKALVRFEWETPLPRYWKLPCWLPRWQRARYLFLSESDREGFLRAHSLIPSNSTFVIPYYVDAQLFKPTPTAPAAPRRTLRVGFAGQWLPGKGCLTLLEAWNLIGSECPEAELWFAGGDKLWKADRPTPGSVEVAEKIREAAGEGRVKIVGELKRAEMPSFWSSLDVAVVPSFVEAFGLVALEAMACGVPVIASKIGGLKEIVQEGVSGLLVPAGDSAALANALVYLLNNKQVRLGLAEGARRRAREYSVERRSGELLSLILHRLRRLQE